MASSVKSSTTKSSDYTDAFIQRMGPGPRPLLVTIPHSGEQIPPEAPWLKTLPETLLMYDVDRYVDELYRPALQRMNCAWVTTIWHRYACDLNRLATDVDRDSVIGSENESGKFPRGLHWSITTQGEKLMPGPIDRERHQAIVDRCLTPFHESVNEVAETIVPKAVRKPDNRLFHLDLHSMPSMGTKEHRDPGERRADVVISDQDGKSASPDFLKAVEQAARAQGFSVALNWPYKGGRITEAYGRPKEGWETIQIELNRALYMDEKSKHRRELAFEETQTRVGRMLEMIAATLPR